MQDKNIYLQGAMQIKNKTVLDIGCNSGFYCLWAKRCSASRVVGVDILEKRIMQAKTLAEIEGLDIEYYNYDLFQIGDLGTFDIVFCFAVMTEIQDMLGAFEIIKKITKQKAYIELAIAKPLIYISKSIFSLGGILDIIKNHKKARDEENHLYDVD